MKLKHTITEGGDELDIDELDKKQQSRIKAAEKVIGGRRLYIMETVHVLIVAFDSRRRRFSNKDLSQLLKLKVRWLETNDSQKTVSVGI